MLGFLYVFHIPIHELKKKIRFLAIASYTHPQGRNAKGKGKRMEREMWKDMEREKGTEGREGGEGYRERRMAGSKRCLSGIRMAGWLADCLAGG